MSETKQITISKEMHKELLELKKRTGQSLTFQIEKALENWIEMQKQYQEGSE